MSLPAQGQDPHHQKWDSLRVNGYRSQAPLGLYIQAVDGRIPPAAWKRKEDLAGDVLMAAQAVIGRAN